MSKLGIQYCMYSKIGTDGNYTGGHRAGTLVNYNGSPSKVDAEDWGDNDLQESEHSVNRVNLSMELNDLQGQIYADLCGHTYDEETKEVTVKSTDHAPFVGIGAIGNSMRNGVEVFILKFYPKMQFSEPNDDNATEAGSRNFGHTTIDGVGYPDGTKTLKKVQEYDSLAAAKTALDNLLKAPTV